MTADVTPAMLREAAADELRPIGQRRIELVSELEALDRDIRPVVVRAARAEVSVRRISRMTGLSTTTITKWTKENRLPATLGDGESGDSGDSVRRA